jgi:hypothetical protein
LGRTGKVVGTALLRPKIILDPLRFKIILDLMPYHSSSSLECLKVFPGHCVPSYLLECTVKVILDLGCLLLKAMMYVVAPSKHSGVRAVGGTLSTAVKAILLPHRMRRQRGSDRLVNQ